MQYSFFVGISVLLLVKVCDNSKSFAGHIRADLIEWHIDNLKDLAENFGTIEYPDSSSVLERERPLP